MIRMIINLFFISCLANAALEPTPVRVLSPVPLPTGAATELTLQSILTSVDGLEGKLDTANGYLGNIDTDLTQVIANQTNNTQRTQLVNSAGEAVAVQTLGTMPTASDYGLLTNSLLYGLTTAGGGAYVPVKVSPSGAVQISGTVLEDNSASILGAVDQLEIYTDGVEGLLTTGNTNTGSIDTKLTTTNSQLTSINSNTDQLEGYVDGLEASASSIDTNLTSGAQKTQIVDGSGTVIGAAQTIAGVNYFPVTLAASAANGAAVVARSIQVAGSDGTNARTILTNTLGQQIVNQSLHYNTVQQNTYDVTTNTVLVGTTETAFCLFRNPNGSGKTVGITSIRLTGAGTFRLYHSPTITANGTALTPQKDYVKAGTQGNVGLVNFSPTISVNGSIAKFITVTAQQGTLNLPLETTLVLPANTAILITAQMGANNTATNCGFTWWEL